MGSFYVTHELFLKVELEYQWWKNILQGGKPLNPF